MTNSTILTTITTTITTTSELIIYNSCAGYPSCIPGKSICKDMIKRISINSQLTYLGTKTIGKNTYDLFEYQGLEFMTPVGALTP